MGMWIHMSGRSCHGHLGALPLVLRSVRSLSWAPSERPLARQGVVSLVLPSAFWTSVLYLKA